MFLAAMVVLATAVLGVGSVAATTSGTPIVDASSGVTTYAVGGGSVVVDPGIVVLDAAGGSYDGARVVIQNLQAGDQLAFTAQAGISGSYDGSSGILSLTGSASAAEYQAAFRSVTYSSSAASPDLSDRQITFSIGTAIPYGENGHFYEYVSAGGISWHDARDAASAKNYLGLQGYLVTVTSQAENEFVAEKLQDSGWIGASDDTAFPYISKDANGNDMWYWVTGPEAGTHFWTGGADDAESANEPAPGQYANWAPGEPNDYFKGQGPDNENYAHFYAWGEWNDYPGDWNVNGYVVEYGGLSGEAEITWQDTKTVAVVEAPAEHLVTIDVKPDSSENPVNPKAKGVLPVAIINTGDLDLTEVDVSTLRLSATEGGDGAAAAHGGHLEDVDGDGDLDLLLHFVNQDIGLTGETTAVHLSGSTFDGVPVVGSDEVDPVPVGKGKGRAR